MSHRTSIIIISRNENPSVLAATIEGVLATTAGRWREIIVVDDASREPVAISAPEILTFRNPEAVGASRARRLGAEMASGDILVWLDAHMSFGSHWLDAFLTEVDSGALLCGAWRNYDRQRIHGWGSDFAWRERRDHACGLRPGFDFAPRSKPPRGRAGPVPMVVGGCYVIAREPYERTGGFCPLFRTYGGEEPDLSNHEHQSDPYGRYGGKADCSRAKVNS